MKKSKKEKMAEKAYDEALKEIEKFTGSKVTYLDQLAKVGKKLFGPKFKGVFPSDKIPKLSDLAPYAILNLDKSTEPGSHWIAIVKSGDKTIIYDSFARKNKQIIPSLYYSGNGTIVDADRKDLEQTVIEANCGSRCLSFIFVADLWGIDFAKLI